MQASLKEQLQANWHMVVVCARGEGGGSGKGEELGRNGGRSVVAVCAVGWVPHTICLRGSPNAGANEDTVQGGGGLPGENLAGIISPLRKVAKISPAEFLA